MARCGVTFITGAGFHRAIDDRLSAALWEWKAAKEALEDGYEAFVRRLVKESLGSLGSFSIKRYFKEARDRVFDAEFIPDGFRVLVLGQDSLGTPGIFTV